MIGAPCMHVVQVLGYRSVGAEDASPVEPSSSYKDESDDVEAAAYRDEDSD